MTSPRRRAALKFTVEVLIASARARRDLRRLERRAAGRFHFRLLAAATEDMARPPLEGWHDVKRQLKIQAVTVGEELQISLQAEGYAALRLVALAAARLVSPDGALNVRFRFDRSGNAFAALHANESVLRALADFRVELEDPAEEAP
jgi:hypothetical protein